MVCLLALLAFHRCRFKDELKQPCFSVDMYRAVCRMKLLAIDCSYLLKDGLGLYCAVEPYFRFPFPCSFFFFFEMKEFIFGSIYINECRKSLD